MALNGIRDSEAQHQLYQLVTFIDDAWLGMHLNDPKRKPKKKKKEKNG